MNLQSILLLIFLAGAFLLAVKKGKNSACCGDCAHCSGKDRNCDRKNADC